MKILKVGAFWSLSFFVFAVLVGASHGLAFLRERQIESPHPEASRFFAPPKGLKYLTFGFQEVVADGLWLRFIQDLDRCQNFQPVEDPKQCHKGWGYTMLLTIHELAPRFRIPMAVGPMSLSVMQNDYEGAGELFVVAANSFPNDWPILYRAAYHFLYEGKDPAKAAEYLSQASKAGGPWWLESLAARMYEKDGQLELALRTLTEYRKGLEDPEYAQKVDERIKSLKEALSP